MLVFDDELRLMDFHNILESTKPVEVNLADFVFNS